MDWMNGVVGGFLQVKEDFDTYVPIISKRENSVSTHNAHKKFSLQMQGHSFTSVGISGTQEEMIEVVKILK